MSKKHILLLCFILLTACTNSAPQPAFSPLPPPPQCKIEKIIVSKSERQMYVIDQNGTVLHTYKISLGRTPEGRKMEEGDGKTPEGRYVIDAHNPNSDYFLSMRISYPSDTDQQHARKMCVKPGGSIFIHGTPNGKEWMTWKYNAKNDWTDGCIAVSNADMREIWNLISDGTPITILP